MLPERAAREKWRPNLCRQLPYKGKGRNRRWVCHHQADHRDARWAHLGRVDARQRCNLSDGASAEEDDMTKDRWRELRRPVVRMRDALALEQLTVTGEPLTSVTAHSKAM